MLQKEKCIDKAVKKTHTKKQETEQENEAERGGTVPGQDGMNGFSDRGLSGRWLDPENDDIEEALLACLESHRNDNGEIAEKNRQVIRNLLNAIKNSDFTAFEELYNKEVNKTAWIDSTQANKIKQWYKASRLLHKGEEEYNEAMSFSRKYLDALTDQAKHAGINKTNLRQLWITIMKGGLAIQKIDNPDEYDKGRNKEIRNFGKKYDSLIKLAEAGNAWAHDGLIDALQNQNELAAVRLVLDARKPNSPKAENDQRPVSFGIIMEVYRDEIWNKLQHDLYGVDPQEIYFLATETMARAWANIWRYEHAGSLLSWLSRIADYVKWDFISKNSKHRKEEPIDDNDPPDPNPTPEAEIEMQELINSMLRSLEKLPEEQREAIKTTQLSTSEKTDKERGGYHKANVKDQEAAEILGVKVPTLKTRRKRGKEKIEEYMLEEGWTPEEARSVLALRDERNTGYAKKRILK